MRFLWDTPYIFKIYSGTSVRIIVSLAPVWGRAEGVPHQTLKKCIPFWKPETKDHNPSTETRDKGNKYVKKTSLDLL